MMFVKKIKRQYVIPAFYGVAWVDYCSGELICMPVPFNVAAKFARDAWLKIKYAGVVIPDTRQDAFDAGYKQAIKDSIEQ